MSQSINANENNREYRVVKPRWCRDGRLADFQRRIDGFVIWKIQAIHVDLVIEG